MIFLTCILFQFFGAVFALYSSNDAVIELNSKNFQTAVLSSNHLWIVEFYAPWCGHCKNLAPAYKSAAKNLKGIVRLGAVDCDADANKPICGQYGIRGFPTIKVFPGGKTGSKKIAIDYNGERTARAIIDHARSKLPDKFIDFVMKSPTSKLKITLDEFYKKENNTLSKVILFTDKKETATLYKALSLEYKDRLLFAEIKNKENDYAKQFDIEKYPSLLVIPKGENAEVVKYDGKISIDEISEFLDKFAEKPKTKKSSNKKEEKEEKPKREPLDPNVPEVSTKEDFETHCVSNSNVGLSTLCVLAFLPPLEPEYQESVDQHQGYVDLLKKMKSMFYDMVETDAMPNMHFLWLDGIKLEKIMTKFGLSTDLPSMMVLNVNKKVYRPYVGAFEEKDMRLFLKETGRGSGRVFKYDWDIELPAGSSSKTCGADKAKGEGKCSAGKKKSKLETEEKVKEKDEL